MRAHRCWWRLLAIPVAGLLLIAGCTGSGGGATKGRAPALPAQVQPPKATVAAGALLGVGNNASGLPVLERFDPLSLRPLPGPRLKVDGNPVVETVAPDRAAAVFGDQDTGRLSLVDLTRMRLIGTVMASSNGWTAAASWSGSSRVLLARADGDGSFADLLVLSTSGGQVRILRDRRIDGGVLASGRFAHGLALLVAGTNSIGPARLLVVDENAGVRTVTLSKISAGRQQWDSGDPNASPAFRQAVPGLAVDPASGRAYVVGADAPVAEVDLGSLKVRYHPLDQPTSPLQRLARWLTPPAEAKEINGPSRTALWLGNGLIAVTGMNASLLGAHKFKQEPSGLQLIDTRTWSSYAAAPHAGEAIWAGGRLLASGTSFSPDANQGYGLTVFGPGDRQPVHLFGSQQVTWTQVSGDLAYVSLTGDNGANTWATLDLRSNRFVHQAPGDLPQLLIPNQP